jgi:hypothetical protein
MNEAYRPVLPHEKRMWKIKHEPRLLEYRVPLPAQVEAAQRPVEINISAGGLLMLAVLELLKNLSNPEGSGIEGQELETPQSEIG